MGSTTSAAEAQQHAKDLHFLNHKQDDGRGHHENFQELAMKAVHHLVIGSKALVEDLVPNKEKPSKQVKDICDEILVIARFLAKRGDTLQQHDLGLGKEDARFKHIALFEGPTLAARGLLTHFKLEDAVDVLKFALVAQRRFFGGEDNMEMARAMRNWGDMLMRTGDKETGSDFQRGGSLMHFRLCKAEGNVNDEELALELNVVGKRRAALGKFDEGLDLERASLEIRRRILEERVKAAEGAEQDAAKKAAAKEDVFEAHLHLAFSLHDLGLNLFKHQLQADEGVALMRESVALRREVVKEHPERQHVKDDLAKALRDLGLALPEGSEERDKLLHESHVMLSKIIEEERVNKK